MSENSPLHRPQPWQIREEPDCFIIEDAVGFPVGYICFAEEEHRRGETGQMSRSQALDAAKRAVALRAAKAALLETERKLKADAGGSARKPIPRTFN